MPSTARILIGLAIVTFSFPNVYAAAATTTAAPNQSIDPPPYAEKCTLTDKHIEVGDCPGNTVCVIPPVPRQHTYIPPQDGTTPEIQGICVGDYCEGDTTNGFASCPRAQTCLHNREFIKDDLPGRCVATGFRERHGEGGYCSLNRTQEDQCGNPKDYVCLVDTAKGCMKIDVAGTKFRSDECMGLCYPKEVI